MESWARAWLVQQCKMIAGMHRAIVLLGAPDRGPYVPVASWPNELEDTVDLAEAASAAMAQRRALVRAKKTDSAGGDEPIEEIAIPLLFEGKLAGGIAVEMPRRPARQQQAVVQLLYWGAPWLEIIVQERRKAGGDESSRLALGLNAAALRHERFRGAATAVATELATHFGCARVSVGIRNGSQHKVKALSHSAQFSTRTSSSGRVGAAMDEAADQDASVIFPALPGAPPQITRSHEALVQAGQAAAIATVPITSRDGGGAITFEWEDGVAIDTARFAEIEGAVAHVGPLLELQFREDRPFVVTAWRRFRLQMKELLGPERWRTRIALAASIGCVLFSNFVEGTYRVAADARLEGLDQRVVVAPADGFISVAAYRAGDTVAQGAVLATLDDRELSLERLSWSSQREQFSKAYMAALASHDALESRVLKAQLAGAEAQIQLLDDQIARAQLRAPFEGIIVSGDLSQSLGAPVKKGEVLFSVAPLDSYRVILEVDEREIADVEAGMQGHLALSAIPGKLLPFTVEKLTPISTSADGRNFFRVEASLKEAFASLRPGMEGVGKINAGERRLAWLWTHDLFDWLRLWLWLNF